MPGTAKRKAARAQAKQRGGGHRRLGETTAVRSALSRRTVLRFSWRILPAVALREVPARWHRGALVPVLRSPQRHHGDAVSTARGARIPRHSKNTRAAPERRDYRLTRASPRLAPQALKAPRQKAPAPRPCFRAVTASNAIFFALAAQASERGGCGSFACDDVRRRLPDPQRVKLSNDRLRELLNDFTRLRHQYPQLLENVMADGPRRWSFAPGAVGALSRGSDAALLALRALQACGMQEAAVAVPSATPAAAALDAGGGAPRGAPLQPGCLVVPDAVDWNPDYDGVTRALEDAGGDYIDGGSQMLTYAQQRAYIAKKHARLLPAFYARHRATLNACLAALPVLATQLADAPDAMRRCYGQRMLATLSPRRGETPAATRKRVAAGLSDVTRICSSGRTGRQGKHPDGRNVSFIVTHSGGGPATWVDVCAPWTRNQLKRFMTEHEGESWRRRDVRRSDPRANEALTFCGQCLEPAERALARMRPACDDPAPGTLVALAPFEPHAGPAWEPGPRRSKRSIGFLTWRLPEDPPYGDGTENHMMPWNFALRSRAFRVAAARVADHPSPLIVKDYLKHNVAVADSLQAAAETHVALGKAVAELRAELAAPPDASPSRPRLLSALAAAHAAGQAHELAVEALRFEYCVGSAERGDDDNGERSSDSEVEEELAAAPPLPPPPKRTRRATRT